MEEKKRGLREGYLFVGRALGLGPKGKVSGIDVHGTSKNRDMRVCIGKTGGKYTLSSLIFTFPT